MIKIPKIPNNETWTKPIPIQYNFNWKDKIMCIEDIMIEDEIIFKKNHTYTFDEDFKHSYYKTLGNFPIVPGRQKIITLFHFFIPLKEIRKQKLLKLKKS